MSAKLNLRGMRFGRLVVLRPALVWNMRGPQPWMCRCDCGHLHKVTTNNLRGKKVQSCGCLQRERASLTSTTHGNTRGKKWTPEYRAWVKMLERCADLDDTRYGARGITVCRRWLKFENFLKDMGPRPKTAVPGPRKRSLYSLERKDNDGDYTPKNCVWATHKAQCRNRSTNRRLTLDGRTMTVVEWSEETGIPRRTIHDRISAGWALWAVLTTPVGVDIAAERHRRKR